MCVMESAHFNVLLYGRRMKTFVNKTAHTLVKYETRKWTLTGKDSTVLLLIYNCIYR